MSFSSILLSRRWRRQLLCDWPRWSGRKWPTWGHKHTHKNTHSNLFHFKLNWLKQTIHVKGIPVYRVPILAFIRVFSRVGHKKDCDSVGKPCLLHSCRDNVSPLTKDRLYWIALMFCSLQSSVPLRWQSEHGAIESSALWMQRLLS